MDALTSTSIIAAFIAGIAALFAPCCITVLLPSYLGSVFKERYKVVLMTFVFFLGILTVFLPIGLGAAALAQFFNRYHNAIFTLGGLMLAGLGLGLIFGKSFSFRSPVQPDSIKGAGAGSVYLLGIFSAIATTCCAPVLAGVLALAAASGSILWGGVYTLSYVLGMVAPLFVIASLLDKIDLAKKLWPLRQPRSLTFPGGSFRFIPTELAVGVLFLGLGGYIIYLALGDRLQMQSSYQLGINLLAARFVKAVSGPAGAIPEFIWALIVGGVISYLVYLFIKHSKKI